MNTKAVSRLLAVAALSTISAFANGSGSLTVSLSTTPAALKCSGTGQYVDQVSVRVIPGGSGKVYVGKSGMNTSTGAGVAQILYPNGGAHSEEFQIVDPKVTDSINMCDLYVAGDVNGETALVNYHYVNGTSGADPLVLVVAERDSATGSYNGAYGYYGGYDGPRIGVPPTGSRVNKIRVQVVPGGSGKIYLNWQDWVHTAHGVFHELYPNSGTISEHSAWSEAWEQQDATGDNGYVSIGGSGYISQNIGTATGWSFSAQVSGESVQVQAWQRQHAGSYISPTTSIYPNAAPGVKGTEGTWYTSAVNLFSGTSLYMQATYSTDQFSTATQSEVRVVPGGCGKFYLGSSALNSSTGDHIYKVLYPNCSGGHSEAFHMPAGTLGGGKLGWTSSPVAVGTTSVKTLTISVIPGQTGKVFVGNSSMDISTGAGVYAVLYPNSTGRWSEEFTITDPQGDGIDTSAIYVQGAVSGEYVSTVTGTVGITPASAFSPKLSGLLYNASSTAAYLVASSSTAASYIRLQTLPGETGKVRIGTASMTGTTQPDSAFGDTVKVLYPNTGNYNVHEGHSEAFVLSCVDGSNCTDASLFSFFTENSGEHVVVSVWGR